MAANQGLYNGFLAMGLMRSIFATLMDRGRIQAFFLICTVVAGVFGGYTMNKRIFLIQAVPALIALLLLLRF